MTWRHWRDAGELEMLAWWSTRETSACQDPGEVTLGSRFPIQRNDPTWSWFGRGTIVTIIDSGLEPIRSGSDQQTIDSGLQIPAQPGQEMSAGNKPGWAVSRTGGR